MFGEYLIKSNYFSNFRQYLFGYNYRGNVLYESCYSQTFLFLFTPLQNFQGKIRLFLNKTFKYKDCFAPPPITASLFPMRLGRGSLTSRSQQVLRFGTLSSTVTVVGVLFHPAVYHLFLPSVVFRGLPIGWRVCLTPVQAAFLLLNHLLGWGSPPWTNWLAYRLSKGDHRLSMPIKECTD